MGQTSQAKIKVNSITQIAFAVADLQKTMENYWSILGIGPWDVWDWEAPLVFDYKYHGKPAWSRAKMALTQLENVELELMEHVDGDTIYPDFIKEHGEGLQHLQFAADDLEETVRILTEEYGFPSLQSGRCGENGAYNYIYIEPLHAIWERFRRGELLVRDLILSTRLPKNRVRPRSGLRGLIRWPWWLKTWNGRRWTTGISWVLGPGISMNGRHL